MFPGAQGLNRHVGVHAARRADRNNVDFRVLEHFFKACVRLGFREFGGNVVQTFLIPVADGHKAAAFCFGGGADVMTADAQTDDGIAYCFFHGTKAPLI